MVKQTRVIFDLADVIELRLVCQYRNADDETPCDGEVLYQFGGRSVTQDWRCPKCGEPWRTTFSATMPLDMRRVPPHEQASFAILQALETLAEAGCAPFAIRFEIDADEGSK